jgi:CopG family transcriptional regulator/antitoxin EndoAI
MLRNTKLITISILPELLDKLNDLAREESRTRSELLREALRRYIGEKEGERLRRYGRSRAKALNLKEKDVERLVDEYRSEQSGVESHD